MHGVFMTHLTITAWWTFGSRTISHTIATGGIETKELCTHAFIFEASRCAAVSSALCIEREERSWQLSPEGFIFMRCIVQTTGSITTKEEIKGLIYIHFSTIINKFYFRKWWKLWTLHADHLKPRSVCLKSDIIYPSSHLHFSAPGPPK